MVVKAGGVLAELTTTVNVLASFKAGEPLSVTRTVMEFVLGACCAVGVQVNAPEEELIEAPEGAPASKL